MRHSRNKRDLSQSSEKIQTVDQESIDLAFKKVMEMVEEGVKTINVEDLQDEYNIKGFNIDKLENKEIRTLHSDIIEKFPIHQSRYKVKKLKRNWCENELKLFVWILFHYEAACGTKLNNFDSENWQLISSVFVNKKIEDCKFEWLSLLKVGPPNEEWTEEEDAMLLSIIEKQESDNKWNDVAKQLYRLSNQLYFRRPKQCRERWRNYLDPNIEKGEWSQEEDSTLLEYVLEIGKKWSAISKCIKNRTQHSVKNRFKSLIKRYKKDNPRCSRRVKGNDSQNEIIKNILKQFQHSEDDSESIIPELPPKKPEKTPRKRRIHVEKQKEEPKKIQPTLSTPFAQCFKQDFNGVERLWAPYSPVATPFGFEKNKPFSNLILMSPRTISPRFRNISDWADVQPDYFT